MACPDIDSKQVWVCEDRCPDVRNGDFGETARVAARFPVRHIRRVPHNTTGNSLNVMEAYREAYETDARMVYLVEDDVMVQPDFFRWHEAVQADGDYFCTIPWRYSRNGRAHEASVDPGDYFTRRDMYASIGVGFGREKLRGVVAHARADYYRNREGYIRTHFGDGWGDFGEEQDGLVMRVMAEEGGVSAWSYVPRAFHVGWWGYHQGGRPDSGRLEERIEKARTALAMLKRPNPDIQSVPAGPVASWSAVRRA